MRADRAAAVWAEVGWAAWTLPKITVRWESAEPIRSAQMKAENPAAQKIEEWSKEFYVISTSGMGRRGGPGTQLSRLTPPV